MALHHLPALCGFKYLPQVPLRICDLPPIDCLSVQIAEETTVKIDLAREGYRSAAVRASVAYFVLDDLARVDPMYQVRIMSS